MPTKHIAFVSLLICLFTFNNCVQNNNLSARETRVLTIDGDPNGVHWHAASGTLYVADDDNNRILAWTDSAGFSVFKQLSVPNSGLGQVIRRSDGTVVVTRFGFGTTGAVVFIQPDGSEKIVQGIATNKRRIGLTETAAGTLYDSWFISGTPRQGFVGELTLGDGGTTNGSEINLLTNASGLQKPVGILSIGSDIFICDKDIKQIWKAPIANPTAFTVFANIDDGIDTPALGPDNSIFVGGTSGKIYKISPAGSVSIFASGLQEVHGIAYDAANKRLFVADHDATPADGETHRLYIYPVD